MPQVIFANDGDDNDDDDGGHVAYPDEGMVTAVPQTGRLDISYLYNAQH